MSKLTYIRCGDYDIPNLKLSEQPETSIGKYGRMRKSYLKEHRPILYNQLLMSEDRIPEFEEYVDVVQIGARNMQNFQLLKAVGKMHKPVLLKRGLCNTIEEWIMSAEYIMAGGNEQVILCERGIRTFEKYTRNTLDLSAVPIIHEKTHLPIIVDPSHATGKANLVEPMMIAAVAAGADGLEVEVHYDPRHAWSDGAQCLTPDAFAQAMAKCRQVAWAIGRDM